MKPDLAWDYRKPRRAITIRLVVDIWLILLTVILLSEGYWGWVLLTGAGAVANFGWPGSPIGEFRRNQERASR